MPSLRTKNSASAHSRTGSEFQIIRPFSKDLELNVVLAVGFAVLCVLLLLGAIGIAYW